MSDTSDPALEGGRDVCVGAGILEIPRDDGRDDVAPFTRPVDERGPLEAGASGLSKSALDRLEVESIPETSESALLPPLPFWWGVRGDLLIGILRSVFSRTFIIGPGVRGCGWWW